ncbi:hypothetical protein GOP47_0014064, partial [Adiantum capillus-veneris]
ASLTEMGFSFRCARWYKYGRNATKNYSAFEIPKLFLVSKTEHWHIRVQRAEMTRALQAQQPGAALLSCYGHARTFCASSYAACSRVMPVFSCLTSPSSGDDFKEAAPSLLKERLSFIHETGFWNTTDPNHQSAMLSNIERDIDKLEHVLIGSEEGIYGSDSYTDAMWETHRKFDTLQEEIHRLQTLLDSKESSLKFSLHEATVLRNHLQVAEAQASSLRLFKESHDSKHIEELSSLERLPSQSLEIIYNHLTVNEAMNKSMEKVGKAWESIARLYTSSVASKLIEILQREASLYFQSIIIFTEELAKAEAQVSSLHQKLINTEGSLEKERKSLRAARDGLDELDCALGNEESKVDDLFKEVSSLKAQLEQKETTVQSLKNEALKNKGLQETARKHLTAFHQSEEKVEQLTAQCNALVNQIKSKNSLLEDIRKEAFDKTEALRLATQIKQELNLCRHREVQLAQELERERLQKNELSHELMENSRAVKAEQALRQAEKDIMDLNRELAFLRNGIKSKDDAIRMMQQKIDGNIQILQSASNDREAMRKMKAYIHSLESKLSEFI